MSLPLELIHEGTLVGAVDSFLKELVHVRPSLLPRYAVVLEAMTDCWLSGGGSNELKALTPQWLADYNAQANEPVLVSKVVCEFMGWAVHNNLVADHVLAAPA